MAFGKKDDGVTVIQPAKSAIPQAAPRARAPS